jgi:hypothetical protein
MHAIKPIMTAGVFAALGLAPAAFAQSAAPTAAPSAQTAAPSAPSTAPQTPSTTTSQPASSTTEPQQGGSNQEAARQALAAARQSLAELTKLPQAQQLQGEQRTAVANFISDFNSFATAQNDWRGKYDVVNESLNRLLGEAESGAAAPASSTASTETTPSTTGAAGATGASTALDPAIVAKLQEVRTHLKEFEQSSGDPLFAVDAIQKQLDAASASGGASGVTLSAAQVENIRKQLETIRQAAKK